MKLAIILSTKEPESVWNVFRLANFALTEKDEVSVFLLAQGVEYETLDSEKFDILNLAKKFQSQGGKILACGTCLKLRQKDGSELCPLSTMKDLYALIKEADKVLTF